MPGIGRQDLRLVPGDPERTQDGDSARLNDFEAYLLGLAIERHVQEIADQHRGGQLEDHERRELQRGARDMLLRRARGSNERIEALRALGRGET